MAVLAKSMANGYAMSAVMGTSTVMDAAQGTFISSTNWTERIGPTAALATIQKYVREAAQDHLVTIGGHFRKAMKEALPNAWSVKFTGIPSLVSYRVTGPAGRSLEADLSVHMLEEGFLAYSQFKPSLTHTLDLIDAFAVAVGGLAHGGETDAGTPVPARHRGFQRLTAE
jgi:glutamate-1-semialdehyde aminotransferase